MFKYDFLVQSSSWSRPGEQALLAIKLLWVVVVSKPSQPTRTALKEQALAQVLSQRLDNELRAFGLDSGASV